MHSTILVPLDGSEFSERALPMAVAIARRSGATLELVHVREPRIRPTGAPAPDTVFDLEAEKQIQTRVSILVERLTRDGAIAAKAVFLNGEISPALEAYITERHADLVVMSTHGRGGLSRAWLGSVADEMLRIATVPLLLVRPDGRRVPDAEPLFRRILVPLDGSPGAENVLPHVAALGPSEETEYLLLDVVAPKPLRYLTPMGGVSFDREEAAWWSREERRRADAYLERTAARLRDTGARVTAHTARFARPAQLILEFARAQHVDLIVLSSRIRSTTARILIGSVADKVLRGAEVPVLLCGPRLRVDPAQLTEASSATPGAGERMGRHSSLTLDGA